MKSHIEELENWAKKFIKVLDKTAKLDGIEIYIKDVGIKYLTGKKTPWVPNYFLVLHKDLDKPFKELIDLEETTRAAQRKALAKAVEDIAKKKEANEKRELKRLLKKYQQ